MSEATKRPGPEPKYGATSNLRSLRVPSDTDAAIHKEAARRGITWSEVVVQTMRRASGRWSLDPKRK